MGKFRAIVFILFTSLFFYVTHQLTAYADLSPVGNAAILAILSFIFGLVMVMLLYFLPASQVNHKAWHDRFFHFAHMALAYMNFLLVLVFIRDLAALVEFPRYNAAEAWLLLIVPALMVITGTLVVKAGPRLKPVTLKFANLPKALEGLRILHITDLHISRNLPSSFIHKLVNVAKKNPADLVVYTGDILDDIPALYTKDTDLLKTIPSKYGNFFVPGNHEYYWQGEETLEVFKKLGFHVLINRSETVQIQDAQLQVCGIPDPAAKMNRLETPDFEKLAKELKPAAFKLLLAHQPNAADQAAPHGFDLQLSGHTHGGQFFPWNFLIGFFQKYGKGTYRIQNMQLYVNQGTGYWGPSLRLGTYCEVAEITLTHSDKM
jgi:predicted MPP superfamily phosphohydrolase